MKQFPAEFSEALIPDWDARTNGTGSLRESRRRVAWFPLVLRPGVVRSGLDLLETHMAPFLKSVRVPIPRSTITGMKLNFTESLPKTLHNTSTMLHNPRSAAFAAARSIGLIDMLASSSLRQIAERVSGFSLCDSPGFQVIRYRPGDYVGPHNDHHPEEDHLRRGYVDLQITLTNNAVAQQLFLHEEHGYFNRAINIGIPSGVSITHLPFWHQVTPLQAKPGLEEQAKRWLLLVSWDICGRN